MEKTRPTGRSWEGTNSGGFIPNFCLPESKSHIISVTFPDGQVFKFQPVASPQCQRETPIQNAQITFAPLPGARGRLEAIFRVLAPL